MGDSNFYWLEDFSMSIEKLRGNLAHATKIKSPGHAICATVSEVEATLLDYNALMAEVLTLRRVLDDLKEAAEETNKQTLEIRRLRQELEYIALAKKRSFADAEEFRAWAQNRARHALGLKPGELTIRKERA